MNTSKWYVIGASVQGTSHQQMGVLCQDSHLYQLAPTGELIIALADGAGTAFRAAEGAQFSVKQIIDSLIVLLKEKRPHDELTWTSLMTDGFIRAHDALVQLAENEQDSVRSFATTLTCAIVLDNYLVVGQIGDGVVIAANTDGALFTTIRPQRGEYANESYFLSMDNVAETLDVKVFTQEIQAVILTTDGLLRLAVKLPEYEPYSPFFRPLIEFVNEERNEIKAQEKLVTFLNSDRVANRTDDDKTLVLAIRLNSSATTPDNFAQVEGNTPIDAGV